MTRLRTFPDRGHVVAEFSEFKILIYLELSAAPYRIIYRVDRPNVVVHAVIDGRRDAREMLAERLLRSK